MCKKFTPDELNKMDHKTKDDVICQMQDRLDRLEQNYENLIEQVRLANQQRFGRRTEKLEVVLCQEKVQIKNDFFHLASTLPGKLLLQL